MKGPGFLGKPIEKSKIESLVTHFKLSPKMLYLGPIYTVEGFHTKGWTKIFLALFCTFFG
jgi:hypothetical protein